MTNDSSSTVRQSSFQVLSFLNNYSPKTNLDARFIQSYLETEFKIAPKTAVFSPTSSENLIDVQTFQSWLENGLEAVSVAYFDRKTVLLGNCTHQAAHIIGELSENRTNVLKCDVHVECCKLMQASPEDHAAFFQAMLNSKLQADEKSLTLVPKYFPSPLEKIIFHSHDHSVTGLGVVREISNETGEMDNAGNVTLFCYYIYPTYCKEAAIGYSMHESSVVNLRDYVFENMLDDDNRSSDFNGVSCLRRLNRELERCGKIWKDKLKRIEPLKIEVDKGEKYWFISDKLKVMQDRERQTPTTHMRYLVGNYFTTEDAANEMLRFIVEKLQDYMASDEWPRMI